MSAPSGRRPPVQPSTSGRSLGRSSGDSVPVEGSPVSAESEDPSGGKGADGQKGHTGRVGGSGLPVSLPRYGHPSPHAAAHIDRSCLQNYLNKTIMSKRGLRLQSLACQLCELPGQGMLPSRVISEVHAVLPLMKSPREVQNLGRSHSQSTSIPACR